MSDNQVKIIQILQTEHKSQWEGILLGLGSNGVTYWCNSRGIWEEYIPNVSIFKKIDDIEI